MGAVPPGAAPKKKNTRLIIILSVVAALVIVGGITALISSKSDPANAKVGDCVQVNSVSATHADVKRVDCSDPSAVYKVTATSDSSAVCDSAEAKYTQKTSGGSTTTGLCLQPNVTAGDCLKLTGDSTVPMSKVDCSSTKGNSDVYKILLFDHTTSDVSKCPAQTTQNISYTIHVGILCATSN